MDIFLLQCQDFVICIVQHLALFFSGGELMHLQPGASNVLSNTAHQLQPGNTVHQLPPGNTVHQMPPGNTVYQLTPGNIAHQLPPGNTAHQLPPGAEIVQMVDQVKKFWYK